LPVPSLFRVFGDHKRHKPCGRLSGRGDIRPIGYILLCREQLKLGQLEKELAIPPILGTTETAVIVEG